jgi:hypothetical protein
MRADLVDAVLAARSHIGPRRPSDRPEDAKQWDALTEAATALRALRDAPVVRFYAGDTEDSFTVNTPEEAASVPRQRVALVPLDTTAGVG